MPQCRGAEGPGWWCRWRKVAEYGPPGVRVNGDGSRLGLRST